VDVASPDRCEQVVKILSRAKSIDKEAVIKANVGLPMMFCLGVGDRSYFKSAVRLKANDSEPVAFKRDRAE
jgi:hypothetical protein